MRPRAVFLLAVGTGMVGLIAGYFLYREKVYVTQVAVEYRDAPSGSAAPGAPTLERDQSRIPALTERPPQEETKPTTTDAVPETKPAIDPDDPRSLPEGSVAEMKAKFDALQAFLQERSFPILTQRLDDGLSEKVADGDRYTPLDYEQMRTKIYCVRRNAGESGWYRAVLPREQYPELYVYKDEAYRLENAIEEREIAEARRKAENPR